jgi:hypothetical protein
MIASGLRDLKTSLLYGLHSGQIHVSLVANELMLYLSPLSRLYGFEQ